MAQKKPDKSSVDAPITVTPEELREAVSSYDLMLPAEITGIYTAMLKVPEFGLRVAAALQNAAKAAGKGVLPKERVMDAAVVPAFLVGLMVGHAKGTGYCRFVDTGERRLPKPGEWYFYVGDRNVCPVRHTTGVALGFDGPTYGILTLES